MKEKLILILLIFISSHSFSQMPLFEAASLDEVLMNKENRTTYDQLNQDPSVVDLSIIYIDTKEMMHASSLKLSHEGWSTEAQFIELDFRSEGDYAWFGQLTDETGIFLTVFGKSVFSKFYMDHIPYTIVPLSDGYHILVGFDEEVIDIHCESGLKDRKGLINQGHHEHDHEKQHSGGGTAPHTDVVDDNCRLRVLIVFTDDADNVLNMRTIGQGMVDETNLGYAMSQIGFRMELARTVRINYAQVNTSTSQSIYGMNFTTRDDLIRIRNGTNGFGTVPTLRNTYKADMVALVKQGGTNGSNTSWGQVYGVPTGTSATPTANNAFMLIGNTTTTTLVAGRFSFAHEIGHAQGARHNTDTGFTPSHAVGHIFGTGTNANRTIMSTMGGTCSINSTGCRRNFFSNPDVNFGGTPVGTSVRDNARRLDETANVMRNHRVTDENLTVSNETFGNEVIANHLANQTITTSGTVNAQNGSIVRMRAGTSIRLNPGFQAGGGTTFCARVISDPCTVDPQTLVSQGANTSDPAASARSEETELEVSNFDVDVSIKNYPNPFSDKTTLEYTLTNKTKVILRIYDFSGRLIQSLVEGKMTESGVHTIDFDASHLPSGIYLCQIFTDTGSKTSKMILRRDRP